MNTQNPQSSQWLQKKCVPCEGGVPVLTREVSQKHLTSLKGWTLTSDAKWIGVEYVLKDFKAAVELINRIKDLAEAEGHHPDLHLTRYRRLKVQLTTHAIEGLSENDFIVAAKIDALPKDLKSS